MARNNDRQNRNAVRDEPELLEKLVGKAAMPKVHRSNHTRLV